MCLNARRGSSPPAASRVYGIGAREKYSANPRRSVTTLTTFGFVEVARRSSRRRHERAHRDRRVGGERRHRLRDHLGGEQRFVALHVDDEVARERRGDLGQAVAAARWSARVMHGGAAERLDRVARSRSSSVATTTASTRRRGRRAAIHVLDHRTAGDVGERLARETGRLVSRGDDGDAACAGERADVPGVPIRVHGES